MENNQNKGVLLVNLGTPDAPTAQSVRRFLSQFLHDKRVVNMNRLLWCPILHGVILPLRSPKVAKSYQSIWMEGGSPLLVHSKNQVDKLESKLGLPVELGMTYGVPSIASGIDKLIARGVEHLIILPLYPQYSATTTAAVSDAVFRAFKTVKTIPTYHFVRDYCTSPSYIKALAASVRKHWQTNGKGDYLLCSYHGIPKRLADNGDIYPQHCEQTTQLLAQELGLDENQMGMAYQSRFGREEWLKPYTDDVLKALTEKGVMNLDVIAPAFSVDCLETLEEISAQYKDLFIQIGGQQFNYIPCLNDSDEHIDMMEQLVK
ncbi:ferrochelatase [Vibrio sp. S4M6]|uniref:ferrochelatase n=1 Tax=Vibrio sinus TaxID=2946865 RepID=UPI00202AA4BC|nr:ferrochelatase [Vibrio sinus]MCL9782850.1 ferrochelatase [Vibrio sinus]